MNPLPFLAALPLLAAPPVLSGGPTTLDAMKHHRRVLVVMAPGPDDSSLAEQRRLLAPWRAGAADRDLTVVEIVGDHVVGAADTAAALRRRLDLAPGRFAVRLVGKDGHVAQRSDRPVTAATLEATIDAMPMRRAGQR